MGALQLSHHRIEGVPKGYADTPGVIAPPPLIYAVPLAAGWYIDRTNPFPMMPAHYAKWIGVAAIALGIALMVFAGVQFWRKHTSVIPYSPTTAIIQSGPFRISRNPIYLADTVFYVGVAILLNTGWPLLLLPLVLLVMHRGVILREERYLEQKFGDEYIDYKMRVRRWL
jgi:protein-S-isoprenylcysteine O-methyltransferase Ste14